MDCLELKTREPTKEEINEMEFWIETGCVHDYYLKEVLGDISIGINAFSDKDNTTNKLFESLMKNSIDYNKLPFDCQARTSQRLYKFWYEDLGRFSKSYSEGDYSRDMLIVLGDPCKGVSIPANKEDLIKVLHN